MRTVVHFARVLVGLDQPHSQVTYAELRLLLDYACGAGIVVELGTYEGSTAVYLARGAHRVFSIDPFFRGRLGVSYGRQISRVHRSRAKAANVEFIKGLSYEVAPNFCHPIDVLFIDADHTYEAIQRDWDDWCPKVRNGGYIALHDCKTAINSPHELGSMQFYREYLQTAQNARQIDGVDSLVVFQVVR